MSGTSTTGLLPEGFHDRLPPHADAAAALERHVLDVARSYGYERVDPPLAEFEESLGARLKAASAKDAVRFTDPASRRTLAIRPDITAQIGRIAATRMAHHPRPVRLSYAGTVLKLRASELRPERAMRQIGFELIGRDGVAAAREVVTVAVEALERAGVGNLALDFTLPDLVEQLAPGMAQDRLAELRDRLDAKDAAGVAAIDADFLPLIEAAGPFGAAIERLRALDKGGVLTSRLDGLAAVAEAVAGKVALTLDPTERHGFEYQSWIGFSLFARGVRGEIGRGGSYSVIGANADEPAVGVSLFVDPILDAGLANGERRRLFLPVGTDPAVAAELRARGWVAVAALDADDSAAAQLCSHELRDGAPATL